MHINQTLLWEEWHQYGLVQQTFPLKESAIIGKLMRDMPMYEMEVKRNSVDQLFRVPYLLTGSIIAAAHDPNILNVVSTVLGSDELVMWGPNLQIATPNEAGLWHTDIESWLWPSLTLIIGLEDCDEQNSTQCIPGSHALSSQPWNAANNWETDKILKAASMLDARCSTACQFPHFADGRFYVFNARCWHMGVAAASKHRKLLLMHYDKASNPRIPYMKNYEDHTWFDFPAAYININMDKIFEENTLLYPTQGHDYRGNTPKGFLYID